MDDIEKTYRCPVCGGELEFFAEIGELLCTGCNHQVTWDDEDEENNYNNYGKK